MERFPMVRVQISPGRIRNVTSVREAAFVLLREWPAGAAARERIAAQKACLAALEGGGDVSTARAAFIEAVRAAGTLVET